MNLIDYIIKSNTIMIRGQVTILDVVDGQPAILLPNQHLGTWSQQLERYVDTGLKVTPEDDANVVKYYKLTDTGDLPQAPTPTGGASSVEELDGILKSAGWSADPLSVTKEHPYQWMAMYGLEQVPKGDRESGLITFSPRYLYSRTLLYNNYAPSPYIKVTDDNIITIVNPDGTEIKERFATTSAIDSLTELIKGVKKQVDKSIYSYEGEGEPSLTTLPTTDWAQKEDGTGTITDATTLAKVYNIHIGDLYTDTKTNVGYRFALKKGKDGTSPTDYEWVTVRDSALTSAIAELRELSSGVVKIWTAQPADGDSYKVGDLWIDKAETGEYIYRHCIAANTPPAYAYSAKDWVQPYALKKDLANLATKLSELAGDLATAETNIGELQGATKAIQKEWDDTITDGMVTASERERLRTLSTQVDTEQAQLGSNVDYILSSDYYRDEGGKLKALADAVLAPSTGTIDKLQRAIADAIADNTITAEEVSAVNTANGAYSASVKALEEAIKVAKAEIDKAIPASVQVGGRNLLLDTDWRSVDRLASPPWGTALAVKKDDSEGVPYVTYPYGWDFYTKEIRLEPSTTYTISYAARRSGAKVETTARVYVGGGIDTSDGVTDKWQRFSHTFTTESEIEENVLRLLEGSQTEGAEVAFAQLKLERGTVATDWTPATEDIQSEIDSINANPPRISAGGTWEVYVPKEGKYVNTGRTSKGDNGKAPIVKDGNWWEWDAAKGDYTDTGVKATGTDGKDAISVSLTRQGRFVTRYRLLNEQGVMLPKPEAIREVEGGVSGAVRVTLQVLKGSTDVTAKAQAGAVWYVNGAKVKVGGATLDLRASDYADGKDDEIKCEVDTTSADKW